MGSIVICRIIKYLASSDSCGQLGLSWGADRGHVWRVETFGDFPRGEREKDFQAIQENNTNKQKNQKPAKKQKEANIFFEADKETKKQTNKEANKATKTYETWESPSWEDRCDLSISCPSFNFFWGVPSSVKVWVRELSSLFCDSMAKLARVLYPWRIDGTGIFTYGNHKFMPNVGKSSMGHGFVTDPMAIARILGAFQVTWNFELQQTCADLIPLWQTNILSCMESIICQCQWCLRKSWWWWNCVKRLAAEQHWSKELKGIPIFNTNIYKYILEISYADQKWGAWKRYCMSFQKWSFFDIHVKISYG